MADQTAQDKAGRRRSRGGDAAYDDWFGQTPDPWAEIGALQYGADRTHATTVERMVMNAEPAQRPALEARLLATFSAPQCTDAARSFVVRMLALIGSAKAVPVLAPALRDPKLVDAARYALDAIADPAVDAAYRAAIGQLSGVAKIGLIGSMASRADRAALPILQAIQQNSSEPADVRAAAGRAIESLAAN